MVQRVTIDPSEVSASRALAAEHKERSPQGSAGWNPSVSINANQISGRVDAAGNVSSLGKQSGTASLNDDGQISVGGMTMSKEVAISQGLVRENDRGQIVAVDDDLRQAIVDSDSQEIVMHEAAETDAEAAENFNQAYDFLEREMGHHKMALLANAVADGDEAALAAVPAPIFDGYMGRADEWADTMGIKDVNSWASALLTGEEQSELIKAVVSGREFEAKNILERGKAAIEELSVDPGTHTELASQGYSMEGTGLNAIVTFPNGGQLSLYDCFLQGHFTA